nr:hypothetical protein [Tanacetum cinerariifolium]
MSIFKVPKQVLNIMESLRRNFFNGVQEGDRKIAWVKWSKDILIADKLNSSLSSSFRHPVRGGEETQQFDELLEENKDILIADKLNSSLSSSFSHPVRGGEETQQFDELLGILASVSLSSLDDRWFWDLSGDGTFQVKGARSLLDETFLPKMDTPTRNILVFDVVCPLCDLEIEDSSRLFFGCSLAKDIQKFICRWWNLEDHPYESYNGWLSWFKSIRLGSKLKDILEGVFYVSWWSIWVVRVVGCGGEAAGKGESGVAGGGGKSG